MQLEAGELDRRVGIESAMLVQDDSGAEVETPTLLAEVWAKAQPVGGISRIERFEGREISAELDYRFVIRYRSDLTTRMRLRFDGRVYDIQRIDEMGRRDALEILARARGE